ncbi:STAS domain-containing protein [Actinacidiphila rubida]|uniref:Stage II sporulation protein AA (Anti-sigma F factor antagonist) n=1 Tax=Actinacidiphila rubida TaxID=310780 RepID=A0A1H8JLJ1_9ACTN|nr:STAS domain-containing protein [Actinacidiphila rubida]SEN81532.1 stage II sporulation protein AA (anti-sigma F factor antagonist) [Actinacidiphila rubida]
MDLHEDGGLRIVRAEAELDWERSQAFAERIREAARADGARVVVDLSAAVFADSSTLHVLLEARRELADRGGRLVLAGPLGAGIRRLFDLTMTSGHFEFAADTAAARHALENGPPDHLAEREPRSPET